jgi:hypothetical protein
MQNIVENSAHHLGLDYIEDKDYDSPLLKARTKQIFCAEKITLKKHYFDKSNSLENDYQQKKPVSEEERGNIDVKANKKHIIDVTETELIDEEITENNIITETDTEEAENLEAVNYEQYNNTKVLDVTEECNNEELSFNKDDNTAKLNSTGIQAIQSDYSDNSVADDHTIIESEPTINQLIQSEEDKLSPVIDEIVADESNKTIENTKQDNILDEQENASELSLVALDSEYSLSENIESLDITKSHEAETPLQQKNNDVKSTLVEKGSNNHNIISNEAIENGQHSNYNVSNEAFHLDFSSSENSHHKQIEKKNTASEEDDSGDIIPHHD